MAQQITNLTSTHEDMGSIHGPTPGLRIQCYHELWWRHGSFPMLLWQWLATATLIWPLAWKLPHAKGVDLKKKKKGKKRKKKKKMLNVAMVVFQNSKIIV